LSPAVFLRETIRLLALRHHRPQEPPRQQQQTVGYSAGLLWPCRSVDPIKPSSSRPPFAWLVNLATPDGLQQVLSTKLINRRAFDTSALDNLHCCVENQAECLATLQAKAFTTSTNAVRRIKPLGNPIPIRAFGTPALHHLYQCRAENQASWEPNPHQSFRHSGPTQPSPMPCGESGRVLSHATSRSLLRLDTASTIAG
jgi:hypothetical protein